MRTAGETLPSRWFTVSSMWPARCAYTGFSEFPKGPVAEILKKWLLRAIQDRLPIGLKQSTTIVLTISDHRFNLNWHIPTQ